MHDEISNLHVMPLLQALLLLLPENLCLKSHRFSSTINFKKAASITSQLACRLFPV
jgi:hypothetical protein